MRMVKIFMKSGWHSFASLQHSYPETTTSDDQQATQNQVAAAYRDESVAWHVTESAA